ncbi:MAG: class I SAM-dependent methyltransferase [Chloroflexaceae bacterium]|nr:class I SAM-dependent methyltransferase [Chloroflexaceae bacterium]
MRFYLSLVRWAFARFYREFAWTYDTVAWLVSRGLWRQWTLAALPYLRGRVLETGCGTGYVQQVLAAQWPDRVVGVDASPQMLALTRRRLRGAPRQPILLRAVAQALPLGAASFDTVLATFPTEYLVHPATIREIRRVLAPGGRLVIVDAGRLAASGLYERILDGAFWLTLHRSVRPEQETALVAPVPYRRVFEPHGFQFDEHLEPVGSSSVMVLVGYAS